VYHQQLSAYSNVTATRLKAKKVSRGIATRRSGILHYCGLVGHQEQKSTMTIRYTADYNGLRRRRFNSCVAATISGLHCYLTRSYHVNR